MAKRIKVLLGVKTLGNRKNIVLDGSPNFPHGFDATFTEILLPLVQAKDLTTLSSV